ncbi:hypothetical protein MetexDRAFT_6159, partial [Methylorubrum extorquens DSM 13060]
RSICLICRMVSCLLAGIPLSSWSRTGMPRLLTRGRCAVPDIGYRVAGFISEWWPTSNRNAGRLRLGMGGRLPSESALHPGHGGLMFNPPPAHGIPDSPGARGRRPQASDRAASHVARREGLPLVDGSRDGSLRLTDQHHATPSSSGVEEVPVGTTGAGETEETRASVLPSARLRWLRPLPLIPS